MTSPTILSNPKIQKIVDQYKAIGWEDVQPVDMGHRLPRIIAWKEAALSVHLELIQVEDEVKVKFINIFVPNINGALGGFWHQGYDITPAEAQLIVGVVTGKFAEVSIEELDGELTPVEK